MKKAHYFFIVPIVLLGAMNSSAQSETKNPNSQVQVVTPVSLDEARQNYATALENAKKAASSSRAENAKHQSLLLESKEKFRLALEAAIAEETNEAIKSSLENELATLNLTK